MNRITPLLISAAFLLWLTGALVLDQRHERLSASLVRAVNCHDAPGVERLLAQGADPNSRDWKTYYHGGGTPFKPPWYEKYLAILMHRQPRVADPYIGPTVLMIASYHGDTPVVQSLLNHSADISREGTRVEDDGVSRTRPPVPPLFETIRDYMTFPSSGPAIWGSPTGSNVSTALLLMRRGAPVNARVSGRTPLMVTNRTEIAAALLHNGADINAAADASGEDDEGKTPLIFALDPPYDLGDEEPEAQRKAMFLFLLKKGANVNVVTRYGVTPLRTAAWSSLSDECQQGGLVRLLLTHGADPNTRNQDGNTELTSTAADFTAPIEYMRLLLRHGADVNAQNNKGQTALMLASHIQFADWNGARLAKLRLLRWWGANTRLKDKQGKTAAVYFNTNPPNAPGS